MIKKMTWILIACLLIPLYNHAQTTGTKPQTKKEEGKTISIVKFIPGLYQLKSRKYLKGSLLLGSFLTAIAGTIAFNNKGNDWYDKYKNSTNVEDIRMFRDQTEKSFKKRNIFIAGIFSVWLVHILDLKFSKSGKTGVTSDIGKNKINFNFYYRF
ncbi:MAG: hypothetical protein GY940_20070 [bacterium]|nr:hypothetical protein [bacterium]